MRPILLPQLTDKTLDQIKDWIVTSMPPWAKGAVMGLSGGIDSSVVAALTARAFGSHNFNFNKTNPPVLGWQYRLRAYSLPATYNTEEDSADAKAVAKQFNFSLHTIPLYQTVEAMLDEMPDVSLREQGNMISRLRAVMLWTKAGEHSSIVMGTGNRDEDYGVGYYTLTGDGLVHFNPIGFLSKRLVREAAKQLNLPDYIVHRVPTAGLEKGQTDKGDLGYSYEFVELVVEALDQGFSLNEIVLHDQVEHAFEDADTRFNSVREGVYDVLHRHEIAKAKAALWVSKVPNIELPRMPPMREAA